MSDIRGISLGGWCKTSHSKTIDNIYLYGIKYKAYGLVGYRIDNLKIKDEKEIKVKIKLNK